MLILWVHACVLCKWLVSELVQQLDAWLGLITPKQASYFALMQQISSFFKVSHGCRVWTYIPAVLSLFQRIASLSGLLLLSVFATVSACFCIYICICARPSVHSLQVCARFTLPLCVHVCVCCSCCCRCYHHPEAEWIKQGQENERIRRRGYNTEI